MLTSNTPIQHYLSASNPNFASKQTWIKIDFLKIPTNANLSHLLFHLYWDTYLLLSQISEEKAIHFHIIASCLLDRRAIFRTACLYRSFQFQDRHTENVDFMKHVSTLSYPQRQCVPWHCYYWSLFQCTFPDLVSQPSEQPQGQESPSDKTLMESNGHNDSLKLFEGSQLARKCSWKVIQWLQNLHSSQTCSKSSCATLEYLLLEGAVVRFWLLWLLYNTVHTAWVLKVSSWLSAAYCNEARNKEWRKKER